MTFLNSFQLFLLSTLIIAFNNLFIRVAANKNNDYLPIEREGLKCEPGLLLPVWLPTKDLILGNVITRGVIYLVCLVYMFVGLSIIGNKFMESIEVITSEERTLTIKRPKGGPQVISVRIGNETVLNLTLMALGSPEILLSMLSISDIFSQNFYVGELVPGTIVGSAAFHMFVTIGICVWSVPSTHYKKIKHLRVFFVTIVWSIFAFLWLFIILVLSSYGVIDLWEALVTFLLFPATVLTAYLADKRLYRYLSKKYRMNKKDLTVGEEDNGLEMAITKLNQKLVDDIEENEEEVKEIKEYRREYIQLMRELREKNPNSAFSDIKTMARDLIINRRPKSRAFYRLEATKKLTGGNALVKKNVGKFENMNNTEMNMGTSSWKEQFIDAIRVSTEDEKKGEISEKRKPIYSDYMIHFITLPWKIMSAFVPPTKYLSGWLCFLVSIKIMGGLTAIIRDLASILGCTVGLKDSVIAITIVTIGISLPDNFASKVAAQNDSYADSSIGYITGNNSIKVFLGIGVPWLIVAIVHTYRGNKFEINPGSLGFSVIVFIICAFVCSLVLMLRRIFGGELGGPMLYKLPTLLLFITLWLIYVLMTSLEAYRLIPRF